MITTEHSLALSANQLGLWHLQTRRPDLHVYNTSSVFRVRSPLAVRRLHAALCRLVEREALLRTTFVLHGDAPRRVVHKVLPPSFHHEQLPAVSEAMLQAKVQAAHDRPFALVNGPLARLAVFTCADDDHVLLLTFHHILLDFSAQTTVTQSLFDLYASQDNEEPIGIPTGKPAADYNDFVAWQQEQLAGPAAAKARAYWMQQLRAPLPVLNLPTDHPLPPQQSFHIGSHRCDLSAVLSQALIALAHHHQITPFTLLLTAFAVLLARYSRQADLIVGIPTNERVRAPARFRETIGHMVNLLPIRFVLSEQTTFIDLAQRTQAAVMGGLWHQHYPFARMVQDAAWVYEPSRAPLFDVSFNMPVLQERSTFVTLIEGTPVQPVVYQGLTLEPFTLHQQGGQNFLTLDLWPTPSGMVGIFKYNTDLFDKATIVRLANHFTVLLEGIVAEGSLVGAQPIHTLPLLTPAEYHQLVYEWNDTTVDFGPAQTIHALFEQQVARTPDAVAVVFENVQLTYRQLNARANQLAHFLRSLPVQAESPIGLYVERSLEMVIGVLAILKAGGAYVPLDPLMPTARLQLMIEDMGGNIIVTQNHLRHNLAGLEQQVVCFDDPAIFEAADAFDMQQGKLFCAVRPDQLAYILYTSGSTGTPKGVAVEHRQVVAYGRSVIARCEFTPGMSYAMVQPLTVDSCVTMLYPSLWTGGVLHVISRDQSLDADALTALFRRTSIDCLKIAPSHLAALLSATSQPQALLPKQRLIIGGETSQWRWVQTLVRQGTCQVYNHYGPTETTVGVTTYRIEDERIHAASVKTFHTTPIGRPLANTTTYILDERLQPVPVGCWGELHIGGPFVTRGYLNRPELTLERFIPNPFLIDSAAHQEHKRLYKTGDWARYLPDGTIEFFGRMDGQVKIRGFRIELGEIENLLLAQEGVRDAVVLAHEDQQPSGRGDKKLVAYLVLEPQARLGANPGAHDALATLAQQAASDTSALRQALAQRLPDYMIPAAFVILDAMPLTPHGKLDQRALPAPDYTATQNGFIAPRTAIEQQVAAIWRNVLDIAHVGVYDNFFALGGHSLLATQVISRVRSQLTRELPLKALFEAPQLSAFAQLISQVQIDVEQRIEPRPRGAWQEQPVPLSFAQQRLWFLDQLEPGNAFYNLPLLLWLNGQLDVAALQASFRYLLDRHESLRTVFDIAGPDGEPCQVIHPPTWATHFTLTVTPVADEAEAQQLAQVETITPFDLRQGLLLHAQLFQLEERRYLLVVTLHHIISDGWSMGVLMNELSHAYHAYATGQDPTLPALPIQYADFALWQRGYLSGETLERQLDYWRKQLAGAPALLELPTDRPRPPVMSYRGARYEFTVDADLTTKLNRLAQTHEATLFMVLLAAFNVLLARYSRQEDIVIGSPIANRNRAEIEGLIGFFVNTLVLRTRLTDNPTFTDLLAQVRQITLDAYQHQDLPFEQLVDALALERTLSYSPLFQVMLVLQNADPGVFDLPNVTAARQPAAFPFAKFDLALGLWEGDAGLLGMFEYATDLFDEATIARMANHFTVLLKGIVAAHPLGAGQPVHTLPLLTAAEYHQLVYEWNNTAVDFGPPQTIQALFEQQVARTPEAIAVVLAETERVTHHSLTYAELNAQANQLAHYLIALGVGADTLVAVAMERSIEMVVALLAVLKAGGAYAPIDPTYPSERIRYMLTDSAAQILLTQSHLGLTHEGGFVIAVDRIEQQLAVQSTQNPQAVATPEQIAYVIYTSGSTGQPKGVLITQHALVNMTHAARGLYQLTATDRILQFASLSFDAAAGELYPCLTCGATLVLRPPTMLDSIEIFIQTTQRLGITVWDLPTAYWQFIVGALATSKLCLPEPLRLVIIGGERALPEQVAKWHQLVGSQPRLMNSYGPTEATVITTVASLLPPDGVKRPTETILPLVEVPIGYPIANTQAYILDATQQIVPIAIAGELHIGGSGLARGYLNQPKLTAERFIQHPQFGRLYKTGDLCRWLPDGNIEYIGRTDFQVKIRGFRIELGEIENALLAQGGVREAVVLAREDTPGDKRLVAYVVGEAAPETLRQALAQRLPDYMVPAAFVPLDALPLTPNGKLDRRALPAPEYTSAIESRVPAATFDETRLVMLWQEVLRVRPIGVTDNFFELGGHSLLATQLVQRMRHTLGRDLALRQIFATPTIRGLLQSLDQSRPATTSFVPLRVGKVSCPPLFLIHAVSGMVFPYATLLPYLPAGQPLYALQARGIYDDLPLFDSLAALATQSIQELKTIQPHGPYSLGGWSFGGMVAFEMARQLRAQGEEIAFLGVIDAYPRTDGPIIAAAEPTSQAALQTFFYLLGDIMGVDYQRLDETLFADAAGQAEPVAWLLDRMNEQGLPPALEPSIIKRIWTTVKHNSGLMQAYQPCCYDGAITLFSAEESAPKDGADRWQALISQPVETVWVKGEHNTLLNRENVERLGRALAEQLSAFQATTPRGDGRCVATPETN